MNKFSLRFTIQEIQDQYFSDQYQILQFFYIRVCLFGSFSAILIVIWEYLVPIGFGNNILYLCAIPILFFISWKLIRKFPRLFNYILPAFNLSIGIVFNAVYLFDLLDEINFMIGQTVALVQLSMMLSTNFLVNVTILLANYFVTILIFSIKNGEFSGYCIILLLAVVLMSLSYYSQEKMKREFFLLKQRDEIWQESLIKTFQIKVLKIKLNTRLNQLQMEHTKYGNIESQLEFKQFLRQIFLPKDLVRMNTSTPVRNDPRFTQNLEQFLFSLLTSQLQKRSQPQYAWDLENMIQYMLQVILIIEQGEIKAILMIREKESQQELLKQRHMIKEQKKLIHQYQMLFVERLKKLSLILQSECQFTLVAIKFNLVRFISDYFTLGLSKINYQPRLSRFSLGITLDRIRGLYTDYLSISKIQFKIINSYGQDYAVVSDQYLFTHLVIILLNKLIQSNCWDIQMHVLKPEEYQLRASKVEIFKIQLIGQNHSGTSEQETFQLPCQKVVIAKILNTLGPQGNYEIGAEKQLNPSQKLIYNLQFFQNLDAFKHSIID